MAKKSVELIEIEKKIKDKQKELKELLKAKEKLTVVDTTLDKIKRYETRNHCGALFNRMDMVKAGESFEEWYDRVCKHCYGAKNEDWKETCLRYYKNNHGFVFGPYIKWLIEVHDERIIDTEAYRIHKKLGGM